METWKDVPGYEGYQVSDLGRVKSLGRDYGNGIRKEIIMKLYRNNSGYYVVQLCKKNKYKLFRVHILVLLAFKGDRPTGCPHSRHLNGEKSDNRPDNLVYGTAKENHDDLVRHGALRFTPFAKGSENIIAKLTEEQVMEIIKRSERSAVLAKEYRVSRRTIGDIRNGKCWGWLTGITVAASLVCASCTPYPADNAVVGGAVGCGLGLVAGPVGCAIGGSAGAGFGLAATPPAPAYGAYYAPPPPAYSYAPPPPPPAYSYPAPAYAPPPPVAEYPPLAYQPSYEPPQQLPGVPLSESYP